MSQVRGKRFGSFVWVTALVVAVSLLPVICCFAADGADFDDRTAIARFFRGRALDSIEGIWKWETKAGKYRGAIIRLDLLEKADEIRREYGEKIRYACLLTRKTGPLVPGSLKMVVKGAMGGIHKGYYIMHEGYGTWCYDKDEIPFSISRVSSGTLAMGITSPQGERVVNEAIRVYPKGSDLRLDIRERVGTGFFVAPGIVATTCSNVIDARAIRVRFRGREMEATVLVKDSINDLALLKVARGNSLLQVPGTPLPIGDARSLAKGASISSVFYEPGITGPERGSEKGTILAIAGERSDPRVFETEMTCQGMRSGAPVLNEAYQVIGILTDVGQNPCFRNHAMVPEGVFYGVKVNYLFNLAASARECPRLDVSEPVVGMNGIKVFDSIVQVVARGLN